MSREIVFIITMVVIVVGQRIQVLGRDCPPTRVLSTCRKDVTWRTKGLDPDGLGDRLNLGAQKVIRTSTVIRGKSLPSIETLPVQESTSTRI